MPHDDHQRILGRLTKWWSEARAQWGVPSPLRFDALDGPSASKHPRLDSTYEHAQSMSIPMLGSRSDSSFMNKPNLPTRVSPPAVRISNGLGLDLHSSCKNTSPRELAVPESASSTTTLTLPTPTSTFKYPDIASYGYNRPRAHSNVSSALDGASYPVRSPRSDSDPSPGLGLKLGDREKGLTLPSLSSLGGNRGRSNSWWKETRVERSPLGIAALISAAEERGEV